MDEIKLRKEAISLFLEGVKVSLIAAKLRRSRVWVYKWVQRFESNPDGDWFKELTRAPLSPGRKLKPEIELQILEIRLSLEQQKYAQIGAQSIQYEFMRLGMEPPEIWTINRVLQRNRMVREGQKNVRKKSLS